jgi:predicted CoA-binding protein
MTTDADPLHVLREAKTIAIVGASPNPDKPSHGAMSYLLRAGYFVIPVRVDGCESVHGVPCVASLHEIDRPIDIVDVFRRPEHCAPHAREAVEVGARSLWLQLGIRSPEARAIAHEAGLPYVEDACTAALHARHLR